MIEGVRGTLAGRPGAAGPAVRGAGGAAVPVRPAGLRPQADDRALRVRVPAGDVQAGRPAAVGLLRPADPGGDQLVGKLDATADRKAGVLRVDAIHEDIPFEAETDAERTRRRWKALAGWLGLGGQLWTRLRQRSGSVYGGQPHPELREWSAGRLAADTEFTELVDPATGKVTGRSPKSTAQEVDEAVQSRGHGVRGVEAGPRRRSASRPCSSWPTRSRSTADELVELQSRRTPVRSRP